MTDPTLDFEGKGSFTLVVTATDADDPGRKATATVTVNLTNENEAPYFDKVTRDKVQSFDGTSGAISPISQVYAENRRTAVVALAAIEPDGDPLRWELTGADAGAFEVKDIPDGSGTRDRVELAFVNQPNFESRGGSDNQYSVTVRATEEMDSVSGGPAKGTTLSVMVQVTDIDEDGKVDIDWLQPEVGTPLMAMATDPDGIDNTATYEWFRAKVANPNPDPDISTLGQPASEWETITTATDAAYTPQGDDAATPAGEDAVDEDKFLLVRATYQDGQATDEDANADEFAVAITANAVRADVADEDNNSPDFRANKTTRTIPENTAKGEPVGRPVMVDINEDHDTLTYELLVSTTVVDTPTQAQTDTATADHALFSIDKATGQITVNGDLSYEVGGEADGEYQVVVRATDPSGEIDTAANPPVEENRDDILVTIKVDDVNEAPGVADEPGLAELSVNEVDSSSKDYYLGLGNTVDADDNIVLNGNMENLYKRTEEDLVDSTSWPEPIAGPDGHLFEYSTPADAEGIGRRLHFKTTDLPDFENPMDENRDNVYEVTIVVVDTAGATGTKSIRITVTDVDETGKLVVAPAQPHLGGMVVATVTDPDGVESITDWNWFSNSSDDLDTATLIAGATMNYYVPKGDATVGQYLWAEVDYRDGESVEDDPVTALDERNDAPTGAVLADDSTDDGTTIQTDYDSDEMLSKRTDNAVQKDPSGPDPSAFPGRTINLEVAETTPSTGYVGVPVLTYDRTKAEALQDPRVDVGGPDGSLFVFAEGHDLETDGVPFTTSYYDGELTQGGTDDPNTLDKFGQLALMPVTHLNAEGDKNVYTVEVMDADADRELGVITVIITVTDVNEAPSVSCPALRPKPADKHRSGLRGDLYHQDRWLRTPPPVWTIGDPVMAMDADRGDTLSYELGGADAASFAIDSDTGQLMTSAALDYETKMEYMVTVTATDSEGETDMIYVTIMVTNVGLDNAYDMDDSGDISRDEVIMAIDDFLFGDGSVTRDDVIAVINLFLFG